MTEIGDICKTIKYSSLIGHNGEIFALQEPCRWILCASQRNRQKLPVYIFIYSELCSLFWQCRHCLRTMAPLAVNVSHITGNSLKLLHDTFDRLQEGFILNHNQSDVTRVNRKSFGRDFIAKATPHLFLLEAKQK